MKAREVKVTLLKACSKCENDTIENHSEVSGPCFDCKDWKNFIPEQSQIDADEYIKTHADIFKTDNDKRIGKWAFVDGANSKPIQPTKAEIGHKQAIDDLSKTTWASMPDYIKKEDWTKIENQDVQDFFVELYIDRDNYSRAKLLEMFKDFMNNKLSEVKKLVEGNRDNFQADKSKTHGHSKYSNYENSILIIEFDKLLKEI